MALYDYTYEFEIGSGQGTVEAKNLKEAEQKVRDSIPTPSVEQPQDFNGLKIKVTKQKSQD